MIEQMKADDVFQTVKIISFSFSGPPQRIPSKASTVYVMPCDMEALYLKRNVRMMVHSFYLVFRLDDKPKWNVMDGASLKAGDMHKLFLDVPTDLTLPKVHADILEAGPNQ